MTEQYFQSQPSVESDPKKVALNIGEKEFVFKTDRGVFSYEKVDKATRILLDIFLEKFYGKSPEIIADVGAGYGPIAVVVADRFQEANQIFAIEPNERAQQLCKENYQSNINDDRLVMFSPSEVDDSVRPDLIVSNPPVRVGKKELYDLLNFWSERLIPGGQMWLVIAKNLGADSASAFLETQCDLNVKRVASKKGFRVLCCKKPE